MLNNDLLSPYTELSRDIAVLRWPQQRAERAELARRGLPRLLLIEGDDAPPRCGGSCLEDWQRIPAAPEDVLARIAVLAERSGRHGSVPVLDSLGQLTHAGKQVTLSPTEERLIACLLASFGSIVNDATLIAEGWPGGDATGSALRIQLTRLRRRIRPLGLEIRSRRTIGHALQEVKPARPGRRAHSA